MRGPHVPTSLPAPVRERLARLAPDQRSAAMADPGPVLCVAPAGSGKTTTVVARLAWRVAAGIDPATVCALTFNRRAAVELQGRVDGALAELGWEHGSARVNTFHALGRAILSEAGVAVDAIVDRQEVLADLAGGPLPEPALRWLDDAFTRLKLDPERGPPASDVATHQAFEEYQAQLRRQGCIDLDDLVSLVLPALAADPRLLARWRKRATVLFVDEAQDLDRTQLDLAVLLAGEGRDIFLVGDDDQTIYAWRLADVRRVLDLAARLPGLRRVDLETNHRCAPEIVARAARLVAHNEERFQKRILASPRASGSVALVPDSGDEVARARWLLGHWPDGSPAPAGERRAVLARTNRELVPYAAVALELGIPFVIESDGLLLEDPGILQLLDRLTGATTGEGATGDGAPVAMAEAGAGTEPAPSTPLLHTLQRAAGHAGLDAGRTGALLAWAAPYGDLAALRQALAARTAQRDDLSAPTAVLTLATIHGTKGLEWDHVACIGHDEGTFPSARAISEAADPRRVLEEERRLAYVAWTRARRTLTIVYDPGAPSTFMREAFDARELG